MKVPSNLNYLVTESELHKFSKIKKIKESTGKTQIHYFIYLH